MKVIKDERAENSVLIIYTTEEYGAYRVVAFNARHKERLQEEIEEYKRTGEMVLSLPELAYREVIKPFNLIITNPEEAYRPIAQEGGYRQ